jgi:hypothetical protein
MRIRSASAERLGLSKYKHCCGSRGKPWGCEGTALNHGPRTDKQASAQPPEQAGDLMASPGGCNLDGYQSLREVFERRLSVKYRKEAHAP